MRSSPLEMARVTGNERQYVEWTCRDDTNAVCLGHLLEVPGLTNNTDTLTVPWNGTVIHRTTPRTNSTHTNSTLLAPSSHTTPNVPLSIAFTSSLFVIMAVIVFAMTFLVVPDVRNAWNITIAKLQDIKHSTPTYCSYLRKATYVGMVNLLKNEKELSAKTWAGHITTLRK